MLLEIAFIAALTVVNGLLAMSELAVVSARKVRLKLMADEGARGAKAALALAEEPGKFLSTVQVGITLVGILNGALGGATVGQRLADWLIVQGLAPSLANPLGVGLVVIVITYFSLVIGELVPKQLSLRHPESIACLVAPAMTSLSVIAMPLVWLLDKSGWLVLKAIGQSGKMEESVTEEEVRSLIAEAESAGVIESDERNMIAGVMRFADRSAEGLMTPRRDVEVLDLAADFDTLRNQLLTTRHARLPVQNGKADAIVGVVLVRDVIPALVDGAPFDPKQYMHEAPVVLDQLDALSVLRAMRASVVHLALVFDEFGHFEGIVTSNDILEAITGAFQEEGGEEPPFVERGDGSYLVEGWMPVDEFAERIGLAIPRTAEYETVAGLVLSHLKRLPRIGEHVETDDLVFEVIDLDGRRIDKVLVTRKQPVEPQLETE